jgi:SAM-dependent methyltransferase
MSQDGAPDLAEMYATNRRFWDESVGVHLAPEGYDLEPLRRGAGTLREPIESELSAVAGDLSGKRVIHLQCHFGADTLVFAQRGADVVGIDFSPSAIEAAERLAAELRLSDRARFVESELHAAPDALGEPASFDLAYVTWGALCWLPDLRAWAGVVAHFLRPGGLLYLAESHPAALVFDDLAVGPEGMPGYFVPYFARAPVAIDDDSDYANPTARLQNSKTYTWLHPLSDVVTALIDAGMSLRFLHEHDCVPWAMFRCLQRQADGMYRWPDRRWLPLAFSLAVEKRG